MLLYHSCNALTLSRKKGDILGLIIVQPCIRLRSYTMQEASRGKPFRFKDEMHLRHKQNHTTPQVYFDEVNWIKCNLTRIYDVNYKLTVESWVRFRCTFLRFALYSECFPLYCVKLSYFRTQWMWHNPGKRKKAYVLVNSVPLCYTVWSNLASLWHSQLIVPKPTAIKKTFLKRMHGHT